MYGTLQEVLCGVVGQTNQRLARDARILWESKLSLTHSQATPRKCVCDVTSVGQLPSPWVEVEIKSPLRGRHRFLCEHLGCANCIELTYQ